MCPYYMLEHHINIATLLQKIPYLCANPDDCDVIDLRCDPDRITFLNIHDAVHLYVNSFLSTSISSLYICLSSCSVFIEKIETNTRNVYVLAVYQSIFNIYPFIITFPKALKLGSNKVSVLL